MERNPAKIEFAAKLRKGGTKAEFALWEELRDEKLDGFKFLFQSPVGKYIADFCCRTHRLVVEVDGYTHDDQREQDRMRDAEMLDMGYVTIRFSEDLVLNYMPLVLGAIRDALEGRPRFRY